MACFRPITCWKPLDGGAVQFRELRNHREIEIPCGQCIGCRVSRQKMWSFRCLAEAALHRDNWFLTLTYAPEHIPAHGALVHRHWQLFAKRVRRSLGQFRYLMCGEYGETTQRPHYHALLFGLALPDAYQFSVRRDHPVFRSPTLEKLWGLGLSELGTVTAQSARYCAGYVLKPSQAPERVNVYTGELVELPKPYGRMSLRPGIGDAWIRRYFAEVFTHGACFSQNQRFRIPDRFKHILSELDPDSYDQLREAAIAKAQSSPDTTPDRLAVREYTATRRLNNYRELSDGTAL